jgi:drug/metabolite transporter (DMT)-like permease
MIERDKADLLSWRVWLAFGALAVIWGIPYFFIRIAVQEVSPLVVAWGRLTLATLVLLPIAVRRGAIRPLHGHMGAVITFALVEFVVPFTAISYGERWISSSVTGILIAGVPLTVAVISRFFGLRDPLGFTRALGLLLGLSGVIALAGFDRVAGVSGWAGVGCMLLATIGYAIGPLIIQRHLKHLDSIGPIAASLAVASVVLLLPALLSFPRRLPSPLALSSIVVLGVLCSAVAMLLMFYLVRHAGAARATVVTYLNPVVATSLGVGLLRERLGWSGYIAFAAILIGSWLATRAAAPAGDRVANVAGSMARSS